MLTYLLVLWCFAIVGVITALLFGAVCSKMMGDNNVSDNQK